MTLVYKNWSCKHPVFVLKKIFLDYLPLSPKACYVTPVEVVNTPIPDQYPSLFKLRLGTFSESYEIKLKQDAQLFVLFTPRSAPLLLRKKVNEELARMEFLNVIFSNPSSQSSR